MKIKKYTVHSLFTAYICGLYNLKFVSISFNFIAVRCMCDLSPLFALLGGGGGGIGGGDNCFIILCTASYRVGVHPLPTNRGRCLFCPLFVKFLFS